MILNHRTFFLVLLCLTFLPNTLSMAQAVKANRFIHHEFGGIYDHPDYRVILIQDGEMGRYYGSLDTNKGTIDFTGQAVGGIMFCESPQGTFQIHATPKQVMLAILDGYVPLKKIGPSEKEYLIPLKKQFNTYAKRKEFFKAAMLMNIMKNVPGAKAAELERDALYTAYVQDTLKAPAFHPVWASRATNNELAYFMFIDRPHKKLILARNNYMEVWDLISGQRQEGLIGLSMGSNSAGNYKYHAPTQQLLRKDLSRLWIYDMKTRQVAHSIDERKFDFTHYQVSPGFRHVFYTNRDEKLVIGPLINHQPTALLEKEYIHPSKIYPTPDGKHVVIYTKKAVNVFALPEAKLIHRMETEYSIHPLEKIRADHSVVCNDSRTFITATSDSKVLIWDILKGELIHTIELNEKIRDPKILTSADSRFLLIYSRRMKDACLINIKTGQINTTFGDSLRSAQPLGFSPDHRYLIAHGGYGRRPGSFYVLKADTGELVRQFKSPADFRIFGFMPGNHMMICIPSKDSKSVFMVDYKQGEASYHGQWARSPLKLIDFTPDQKYMIAYAEHHLALVEMKSGANILNLEFDPKESRHHLSQDRRFLAYINDKQIELWNLEQAKLVQSIPRPEYKGIDLDQIKFSASGNYLVLTQGQKIAIVYESQSGKLLHRIPKASIRFIDIPTKTSPDRIAFLSYDEIDNAIDLQTGKASPWPAFKGSYRERIYFSPDHKYILYSERNNAALIELESDHKTLIKGLLPEGKSNLDINAVEFSPDMKWLALEDNNSTVHVINLNTKRKVHSFKPNTAHLYNLFFPPHVKNSLLYFDEQRRETLRFNILTKKSAPTLLQTRILTQDLISPDGRYYVQSRADQQINNSAEIFDHPHDMNNSVYHYNIYDIKTNKPVARLKDNRSAGFDHSAYRLFSFSPDGKYFISTHADHSLRVWDWKKNQLIASLPGHTSRINYLKYDSSGQYLISADINNRIFMWNMKPGKTFKTFDLTPYLESESYHFHYPRIQTQLPTPNIYTGYPSTQFIFKLMKQ